MKEPMLYITLWYTDCEITYDLHIMQKYWPYEGNNDIYTWIGDTNDIHTVCKHQWHTYSAVNWSNGGIIDIHKSNMLTVCKHQLYTGE